MRICELTACFFLNPFPHSPQRNGPPRAWALLRCSFFDAFEELSYCETGLDGNYRCHTLGGHDADVWVNRTLMRSRYYIRGCRRSGFQHPPDHRGVQSVGHAQLYLDVGPGFYCNRQKMKLTTRNHRTLSILIIIIIISITSQVVNSPLTWISPSFEALIFRKTYRHQGTTRVHQVQQINSQRDLRDKVTRFFTMQYGKGVLVSSPMGDPWSLSSSKLPLVVDWRFIWWSKIDAVVEKIKKLSESRRTSFTSRLLGRYEIYFRERKELTLVVLLYDFVLYRSA